MLFPRGDSMANSVRLRGLTRAEQRMLRAKVKDRRLTQCMRSSTSPLLLSLALFRLGQAVDQVVLGVVLSLHTQRQQHFCVKSRQYIVSHSCSRWQVGQVWTWVDSFRPGAKAETSSLVELRELGVESPSL
jgi:hypothetical protein